MASRESRELAAQAWCKPTTSGKVVDHELCEAFAEILDSVRTPNVWGAVTAPTNCWGAAGTANGNAFTFVPPAHGDAVDEMLAKYEAAKPRPGVDFVLCGDGSKTVMPYEWAWEPRKGEPVVMADGESPLKSAAKWLDIANEMDKSRWGQYVKSAKGYTPEELAAAMELPAEPVVVTLPKPAGRFVTAVGTPDESKIEYHDGIFDIADRLPSVLDRLRVGQREEAAVMLNRELRVRGLRPDGRMVDPDSLAEAGGGIVYRWKVKK